MSGLTSLSRHFAYAWMCEPKPGELEYLGGVKPVAIGGWYRGSMNGAPVYDTSPRPWLPPGSAIVPDKNGHKLTTVSDSDNFRHSPRNQYNRPAARRRD